MVVRPAARVSPNSAQTQHTLSYSVQHFYHNEVSLIPPPLD